MTSALSTGQVLIVDDEPSVRLVIEHCTRVAGGVPVPAASVADARHLLDTDVFDVAIIDKNLGDGSGLELVRALRLGHPEVEVVVLTGYANVDSAVEALRLGAADYILKPFSNDALIHRLRQCLSRRQMQRQVDSAARALDDVHRLVSLGTVAAGVGHEINNPIAYVGLNLRYAREVVDQLLGEKDFDAEHVRAQLKELACALGESAGGVDRVIDIVKDLKAMSRSDGPAHGPVDLAQAIDVAWKLARAAKPRHVTVAVEPGAVRAVVGSHIQLSQVLLNLIVNGMQACPEGRPGTVTVRAFEEAGRVVVEVQDDGVGIEPALQARIFEPFFTTKPAGMGTGLGLALCRRGVEQSGGELSFVSDKGKGTTFRVSLPPAPPSGAAA